MVPLLLWAGDEFGVSENLRHICAAVLPTRNDFFRYDWKATGLWNLTFALGIVLGGAVAGTVLASPDPLVVSDATTADLEVMGLTTFEGLAPQVFSWEGLATAPGFVMIVIGGFLVGFGARYAGECTSGHAISGLANLPGLGPGRRLSGAHLRPHRKRGHSLWSRAPQRTFRYLALRRPTTTASALLSRWYLFLTWPGSPCWVPKALWVDH